MSTALAPGVKDPQKICATPCTFTRLPFDLGVELVLILLLGKHVFGHSGIGDIWMYLEIYTGRK